MPLEPNIPKQYPVTVFSSLDENAPKITAEKGSMKTVLKACLINGYGDKAGLNWQVADETAERAVFYSTDPDAHGHGLMVDNSINKNFIRAYMVGGENFATAMTYSDQSYHNFPYCSYYGPLRWYLIATHRAFALVIWQNNRIQFLFFGDVSGSYKDNGNTALLNTAYDTSSTFNQSDLYQYSKPPQIVRSQWQGDGNAPLTAKNATFASAFLDNEFAYPDASYQDACASVIALIDGASPRATLPLFACAHNLNSIPDCEELFVNGRRFMKLNIGYSVYAKNNFLLPLDYWAI